MLNKLIKLFVFIWIFYQTPGYSKSASFYEFNSRDLSNYFSGIIAYENRDNSDALKFFNSSKVLLDKHDSYLKRYVYSLVLDNKVARAINVITDNSNNTNSDFFDAYILLIVDSLKKNNFIQAEKYLDQSLKFQSQSRFNLVIFETLRQYLYTFKNKKIFNNKKKFGNISIINQAFQRCYLKKDSTSSSFLNLVNNPDGDYSRYIFFYINYLVENNKKDEARAVANQLEYINSTLLLTQSKSWVDSNELNEFNKIFSCNNHNDIVSEFLFLISNLYSSQNNFEKSNFYLNLSNYLNPKFILNLSLVAENFYLNQEYKKAKKILKNFGKDYEFYYWFRVKKEAQIIIKEQGYENGINYISSKFSKIKNPNVKMIFDIANFYKNSKKYEKAIEYYTKIILSLSEDSDIKSDLLYRRGGSYERLKDYKKADKDLLQSLRIKPEDAYVLNYLAYSWLERDYQIDKAIEMLERAYALRNNDPYIIDSIGWAYYLIKNYVEAEKYIKRAVELMPEDATVNDHYGDILWKLNRKIQARYFWKNVLNLDNTDPNLRKKIDIKIIEGLKNS
ncbi:tetratricopeptide repeat protein [Candidatus Pelagibacter bacterium nBUS_32]|uniref:tetratricopeptide repeat protein n=1 Tax=Candidatus Pelagibacter bacterium nBUS_32 TaxID=3374192 RepID=UPI003EBAADB7